MMSRSVLDIHVGCRRRSGSGQERAARGLKTGGSCLQNDIER